MLADLLEGHAVAPIILAGSSKAYPTARKHLPHYFGNLAHAIIMRSIAHIEYFIVSFRCTQRKDTSKLEFESGSQLKKCKGRTQHQSRHL